MSLKGRRCIPVVIAKEAAEEEVTARMKIKRAVKSSGVETYPR